MPDVGLGADGRVRKALETWHPNLRTAISADPKGWAKFDFVKMPDYEWGVLLAPAVEGRTIPFGRRVIDRHKQRVINAETCRCFTRLPAAATITAEMALVGALARTDQ